MEVFTNSPRETKELAIRIAKHIKPGDVIALQGGLGSGKTTFTGYLVEALGIKARVQSPTFVIMRNYTSEDITGNIKVVNHLDLYRLNYKEELDDLGLQEIIDSKNDVTVIEWPELAMDSLPKNTIRITFESVNSMEKRKITIKNLEI